jgi:hypothetical protein
MAGAGPATVRRGLVALQGGATELRRFRLVSMLLFANMLLAMSATLSIRAVADEVRTPDCSFPRSSTRAESGSLDLVSGDHWQPRGSRIDFRTSSPKDIPPAATVLACFGWLYRDAASAISFDSRPSWIIEPDRSISGTATVPDLPPAPPRWSRDSFRGVGVYSSFWLVPIAQVRILAIAPNGNDVLFDSQVNVGISDKRIAATAASILVASSFLLLWPIRTLARREQPFPLRLICNRAQRASLSYFQTLLITIVLTAALSYLIVLSGGLVGLPTSASAILLISALTTLASRWHTEHAHIFPGSQSDPRLASPERRAKWRDLIASQDYQSSTMDVTRLQMLAVTLLAAFIILKRIANEPTFPAFPYVLLLFAVSNGIYLARKFAAVSKSLVEFGSLDLVEKGVRRVLAPPPLVDYDGYLVCRIITSSGAASIDADRTYLVPSFQSCRMELQLQPAPDSNNISARVLVEQGDPQSVPREAIFQVEMNSDDLEPQSKFFEIKGRTGVFGLTEPVHLERLAMQPVLIETAIRIILSQGGRVVQFLSVRLREERNG